MEELLMSGNNKNWKTQFFIPKGCNLDIVNKVVIKGKEFLPMVHGEWMPIYEANEFGDVYQSGIYCSECGEHLGCEANYCPNCGAKMDSPCADCQEFDCYGCEYKKGTEL